MRRRPCSNYKFFFAPLNMSFLELNASLGASEEVLRELANETKLATAIDNLTAIFKGEGRAPTQEEAKQLLVAIKMLVYAPAAEEEEEAIKFKATFGQVLARRMRKDAFLDGRGWA